jgi:hypothetical protein
MQPFLELAEYQSESYAAISIMIRKGFEPDKIEYDWKGD